MGEKQVFITLVKLDEHQTKLAFQCPRTMTIDEVDRAIKWVRMQCPERIRIRLITEIILPDNFFDSVADHLST